MWEEVPSPMPGTTTLDSNTVDPNMFHPHQLDPAAHPTSLFGAGGLFNFNYVRIARQADGKVHLIADVRNDAGLPLPGSLLDLIPR